VAADARGRWLSAAGLVCRGQQRPPLDHLGPHCWPSGAPVLTGGPKNARLAPQVTGSSDGPIRAGAGLSEKCRSCLRSLARFTRARILPVCTGGGCGGGPSAAPVLRATCYARPKRPACRSTKQRASRSKCLPAPEWPRAELSRAEASRAAEEET